MRKICLLLFTLIYCFDVEAQVAGGGARPGDPTHVSTLGKMVVTGSKPIGELLN